MRGLAFFLILWLMACGGGGESSTPADAPPQPDADPSATCLVPADYGDLGTKTGTMGPAGASSLTVVLDAGPPRDSFFINLRTGREPFTNGLATGTYQLAGGDSSTCGICINIIADIVTGSGPTKFYFATSGMVTLTSHTPPAGSVTNLAFLEVTASGTPTNSGCISRIDSLAFSM